MNHGVVLHGSGAGTDSHSTSPMRIRTPARTSAHGNPLMVMFSPARPGSNGCPCRRKSSITSVLQMHSACHGRP
jgi:hypothetical protein